MHWMNLPWLTCSMRPSYAPGQPEAMHATPQTSIELICGTALAIPFPGSWLLKPYVEYHWTAGCCSATVQAACKRVQDWESCAGHAVCGAGVGSQWTCELAAGQGLVCTASAEVAAHEPAMMLVGIQASLQGISKQDMPLWNFCLQSICPLSIHTRGLSSIDGRGQQNL